MEGDADIAQVAAAIAEPARARILLALADGRALPASVLAAEAGVAASTASGHLGRLQDAGLLRCEPQGRHRYYRLAGDEVGGLLEALARTAPAAPVRSLREGTRANAVRRARYCHDHLGGRLGVAIMGGLLDRGALIGGDGRFDPDAGGDDRLSAPGNDIPYELTPEGGALFARLGVDTAALAAGKRPVVRYCVDWSEQRHHLSGALGAALARQLLDREWLRREDRGRAVHVTDAGRSGLREALGVEAD